MGGGGLYTDAGRVLVYRGRADLAPDPTAAWLDLEGSETGASLGTAVE